MYNELDYDDVLAADSANYDAYEALNDWIDRLEHADEEWEKHQKELEAEQEAEKKKETAKGKEKTQMQQTKEANKTQTV